MALLLQPGEPVFLTDIADAKPAKAGTEIAVSERAKDSDQPAEVTSRPFIETLVVPIPAQLESPKPTVSGPYVNKLEDPDSIDPDFVISVVVPLPPAATLIAVSVPSLAAASTDYFKPEGRTQTPPAQIAIGGDRPATGQSPTPSEVAPPKDLPTFMGSVGLVSHPPRMAEQPVETVFKEMTVLPQAAPSLPLKAPIPEIGLQIAPRIGDVQPDQIAPDTISPDTRLASRPALEATYAAVIWKDPPKSRAGSNTVTEVLIQGQTPVMVQAGVRPEEGMMRSLWPQDNAPPTEEPDAAPHAIRSSASDRVPPAVLSVALGSPLLPQAPPADLIKMADQPTSLPSVQRAVIHGIQPAAAAHPPPLRKESIVPTPAMEQGDPEPGPIAAPASHLAAIPATRMDAGPGPASMPPAVHLQIAQAVGTTADGVTELRLSPEELGQVRIDLRSDGDRLVVAISAERPETLDLLRRHADQLSAELRASGQNQLDLSFGKWSGQGANSNPKRVEDDQPKPQIAPVPMVAPPAHYPSAGLYLRV